MDAFRDWRWRNGSRKEGIDEEVVELTVEGTGCGSRNKSRGGILESKGRGDCRTGESPVWSGVDVGK